MARRQHCDVGCSSSDNWDRGGDLARCVAGVPRRCPGGARTVSDASQPALELRGVDKFFGPLQIISDAALLVQSGERHALIGPNGAGKSTLFNLISGLFAPSAGEIRLRGRRIDGLPPEKVNRLGLGRSFQLTSVFSRLTAFENLRVATLRRFGVRFSVARPASCYAEANARADDLLKAVNL